MTVKESMTLDSSSAKRRSTGPRTMQGKARSRHNALEHGIFSKVVLLPDESWKEYRSFLNGIRRDLQPVGTLEINIVDEFAAVQWRKRRLFIAEGAEIRKSREFLVWDQVQALRAAEAEIIKNPFLQHEGVLIENENPFILRTCLELLQELKSGIKHDGLFFEDGQSILNTLYGERPPNRVSINLRDMYQALLQKDPDPSDQRQEGETRRAKDFLRELSKTIINVSDCIKYRESLESERMKLIALSRSIPDEGQMDRFLRYGTSLGRESERLLKQLERRQRMRLGEPLPPQINVNVSSDG